jgi:hypothetical protein
MSTLRRSLTVSAPLERVADYLCDLTTSVEWDPHTVACVRRADGEPQLGTGARYDHTREFAGHRLTLEATVVDYAPRERIAWSAGNDLARGTEAFAFARNDEGRTVVTHSVEVELSGVARIGERMVPSVMRRIADDGEETLRRSLERLR